MFPPSASKSPRAARHIRKRELHRYPLSLELTKVSLLLWDVPLSTFVSVGSAFWTDVESCSQNLWLEAGPRNYLGDEVGPDELAINTELSLSLRR